MGSGLGSLSSSSPPKGCVIQGKTVHFSGPVLFPEGTGALWCLPRSWPMAMPLEAT